MQNLKCDKNSMLLYAVSDRSWLGNQTLYEQIELALKGGATCVQIREKKLGDEEFLKEATEICKLCKKYAVPCIINDNIEVALKCGADGIHVGQSDMNASKVRELIGENMLLGVSASTVEQAVEAYNNGADYLGVGAVYSTSTKLDASSVPHSVLKEICKSVPIPVVAIGGISKGNIANLKGNGLCGVALVSAIFASSDIENETRQLRKLSEAMVLE